MAIRKETNAQKPEKDEQIQNTNDRTKNQEEETKTEVSKSKQIETTQKKETAPEIAKEEKENTLEDLKHNPVAMTAFLLDLHAQQFQQPKPTKRSQKLQVNRKKSEPPSHLSPSEPSLYI